MQLTSKLHKREIRQACSQIKVQISLTNIKPRFLNSVNFACILKYVTLIRPKIREIIMQFEYVMIISSMEKQTAEILHWIIVIKNVRERKLPSIYNFLDEYMLFRKFSSKLNSHNFQRQRKLYDRKIWSFLTNSWCQVFVEVLSEWLNKSLWLHQ